MEIFLKILPIAVSVIFSALSVIISFVNVHKANQKANYLEKDKQYADLLKLSLPDPALRDYKEIAERTAAGDKSFIVKYNTYAYLIWNCMETFYDLSHRGVFSHRKNDFVDETWLPAIREENKLHYNWFKQNQRLYKADFQAYINKMNDVSIRRGTKADLDDVYALMREQFAPNELQGKGQLADLMDVGKYELHIIENPILSGEGRIIGYAFVFVVDEYKSMWIDFIAINKIYQDGGYGTLLFNKLLSTVGDGQLNAFMEVEIPYDPADKTEVGNRRIRFYEKQGAQRLNLSYRLPTREGGFPMYLYFRSTNNTTFLSRELLCGVIGEVLTDIYEDIPQMPEIRDEVLAGITDLKL
jgi:N-acetylglutamate synthase-like GNAT family acetyltransferase